MMQQNIVGPLYGQRFLTIVKFENVELPVLQMDEHLIEQAQALKDQDVTQVVLCVDEDSAAIRALSPRFLDETHRNEFAAQIERSIKALSQQFDACIVALTVEELCPGGLDPSDGIALAQRFVAAGASAIIASGGTVDFLPLKHRRQTQHKTEGAEESSRAWPEAWLSSALWLVDRVNVPVFAQGPLRNRAMTLPAAQSYGLAGIIDTSVMYPSSL